MGAGAAYPPCVGDLPWAGDSAARPTCNSFHGFHSVPTDSPGGFAQPTILPFLHLSPSSPESGGGTSDGDGPAETRAREDQEPCSKRTVTLSLLFCHNAQRGHRTFVRTGWL